MTIVALGYQFECEGVNEAIEFSEKVLAEALSDVVCIKEDGKKLIPHVVFLEEAK